MGTVAGVPPHAPARDLRTGAWPRGRFDPSRADRLLIVAGALGLAVERAARDRDPPDGRVLRAGGTPVQPTRRRANGSCALEGHRLIVVAQHTAAAGASWVEQRSERSDAAGRANEVTSQNPVTQ